MKVDSKKVCRPCQIKKQIQKSHKMVQHLSTTRVLELLYIDLMGPMQVERVMLSYVSLDHITHKSFSETIAVDVVLGIPR